MKAEELRVLDVDELLGRLKSSRRELYELRFKLAVGQLDDHRQIRQVRQDIARILTFKRQRELGLAVDEQAEPAVTAAPAAPAATTTATKTAGKATGKTATTRAAGKPEAEPVAAEEDEE